MGGDLEGNVRRGRELYRSNREASSFRMQDEYLLISHHNYSHTYSDHSLYFKKSTFPPLLISNPLQNSEEVGG